MEFKGFMEKIMQRAKSTKDVVVRKSGDVAKMTKLKMALMKTILLERCLKITL